MNKDVRDGLLIGAAFAGLVSFFPAQANAQLSGDELCEGSIKYAIKFMPEEGAFELHKARWQILDGDNTNDDEKLVGLVMFEIGQRISYSMNEEQNRTNTEWWDSTLDTWYNSCQAAVDELNKEDLSEMDGAGDIW
jgi:hypothetical protein